MPFIQTCLAQNESTSPKATTQYVYNMSLFVVDCLLNRWPRASSARCLQKKARGLTTTRGSNPTYPDSADVIEAEIQVSQRCALRQHSCKPFYPGWSDVIEAETEVSQCCALPQHSCKTLCPSITNVIPSEIEIMQRSAIPQHSCKKLCPGWSNLIVVEIEVSQDLTLRQHSHKALRQHSCKPFKKSAVWTSPQRTLAEQYIRLPYIRLHIYTHTHTPHVLHHCRSGHYRSIISTEVDTV
jgi:hypothetical protein